MPFLKTIYNYVQALNTLGGGGGGGGAGGQRE